jgi:hypothetical protein
MEKCAPLSNRIAPVGAYNKKKEKEKKRER